MTFDELKLCIAIQDAYLGGGDRPSTAARLEGAKAVLCAWLARYQDTRFPYSIDDIERWRINLRKNTDTRIKTDIAVAHGLRCFWSNRGLGECSDEAEAGHIVARCNGGALSIENAMIECHAHNNERRELTIEEYVAFKQKKG